VLFSGGIVVARAIDLRGEQVRGKVIWVNPQGRGNRFRCACKVLSVECY
jgi:predicted aconitase with swiveling domain